MNGKKGVIMKKFNVFACFLFSAFFLSCETLESDIPVGGETSVTKVPMTFSASISLNEELSATSALKVEVGSVDLENKKLTFSWKKGDKIAVYDDKSSTPNEFTADADGATTSFSGSVSEGATKFIAIYPYSAAVSVNVATGACEIDFPQEQTAVAGSFDPEALVSVGSAEITDEASNPSIRFRLLGGLLSFSVDFDNVVFVEFSGSRPMSGDVTFSNAVGATGPTSVATGTPNYKNVTLKPAGGASFVKGETYYVSVRHTGSNSQEGFTAKLITADAQVASRTGSSNLQIARKTLYPLGTFNSSNVTFVYDRYAVYMAGFDVTIGGKTYNRATDGDATLLADGTVFKTGNTGVIFVDSNATITNTSEVTITGNVILASNDLDHPAKYTPTKSFLLKSGSLVMDHLAVDMAAFASSGQFFTKKDNDGNFTSLNLEGCHFKNIKRPVYAPNSAYLNNGIESIRINGCIFATSAAVQLFSINSGATTLAGYKDFTFTNNVFYSTGNHVDSYVFATSASVAASTCQQEVVMDNNLFYNIAASNGIFRTHALKSIYIRNNVLWAEDGNYSSNIKMFKANSGTDDNPSVFEGASSNNYCYGNLGSKKWSISDAACRGPLTNVTTLTETPIATAHTATGTFTLTSTYSAYGPQPMPIPM